MSCILSASIVEANISRHMDVQVLLGNITEHRAEIRDLTLHYKIITCGWPTTKIIIMCLFETCLRRMTHKTKYLWFREAVRPECYIELKQGYRLCPQPSAVPRQSSRTTQRSSSSSSTMTICSHPAWKASCTGLRTWSSESWSEMPEVMLLMGSR